MSSPLSADQRAWLKRMGLLVGDAPAPDGAAQSAEAAKPAAVGEPLKRTEAPSGESAEPAKGAPVAVAERAQADELLPALKVQRQLINNLTLQVEAGQVKIDKLIASAKPEHRAELQAKKAKLDAALKDNKIKLDQLEKDIEAIQDPQLERAQLAKIIARSGSKDRLAPQTEVTAGWGAQEGKLNEVKHTSKSTSVEDGVATVDKREVSATVGLGEVTVKGTTETQHVTRGGSTTTTKEVQVKGGLGGLGIEHKSSVEAESKGKTSKQEHSGSLDVGPGGIKIQAGTVTTAADGSSKEVKASKGLDRGDGTVGVSSSVTATTTSADGQALTGSASSSGGLVAGKDGIGTYQKSQAEVGTQRKNGFNTGAVGGLHSKVVCNIGDPIEAEGKPTLYPVSLKVNLGADVTLKTGAAKKGAAGKAGAEVKLGAEVVMTMEHRLDETQLAAYVESLKTASGGGKAAGTALEFRVIQAGVKEGWAVACALWKGNGSPLSKEMIETLQRTGDSVTLENTRTTGAKVSGDFKAVSAELGAEQTEARTTKVSKGEDATLDIETDATDSVSGSIKLGLSMGAVGGSIGKSHTVKTSFGYDITVDTTKDPDGKVLAELQRLSGGGTEADYERFIAQFKDRIKVTGRKSGNAESDTNSVGMSVAAAEASIGLSSGVSEQKKTDASGKVIESTVVGSASAGGGFKLGDLVIGDSGTDQAVARRSADGDVSLELSHVKKETSFDKLAKAVKSKLPFLGDDDEGKAPEGKPKGLLATLAGGGDDDSTESMNQHGFKLGKADLEKIGKMAFDEATWTHAAGRKEEYDDWRAVAKAIRAADGDPGVVADELARFVGGDKIHRAEVLNRLIRPPGQVALGSAFEFPESLKSRQKDYAQLIEQHCEDDVRKLAASKGAQAAGEAGQKLFDRIEALRLAWTHATDFSREGIRAEMLSAIAHRKSALSDAMRELAGKNSDDDRRQAQVESFGRLNRELAGYRQTQDELMGKVNELLGSRHYLMAKHRAEAEVSMRALSDLYAIWKRDLDEAVTLAKSCGIEERRYAENRPNLTEWERLKKECSMSDY